MKRTKRKFSSLRHLRLFLGKRHQEMADLAGCTRHATESIEYHRLPMSAQLGAKIAAATGCDFGWLMANDPKLPFVNSHGRPYAKEDAERAAEKEAFESIQIARSGPEIGVLGGADLLHRVLQAAQARNEVPQFINRLEHYVRSEVGRFAELKDEIYAEIRGTRPNAMFIFPRSLEPFRRIRRRASEAIKVLKIREQRLKSD